MGIQDNGAFGGFHGKTGPLIGRRVKGQNIVGPLPHPSNKPSTALQVVQHQKFTMLTEVLSHILALVQRGFKAFAKRNTTSNVAYSYNYDRVFEVGEDQVSFNFSRLVYSRGSVAMPNCPSIAVLGDAGMESGVGFSWLPEHESQFNRSTDLATFLVYKDDRTSWVLMRNAANRGALGYVADVPFLQQGGRLHCYMNFESKDGKLVGDSMYVGEVGFQPAQKL
jgi:hypothetical protein